MKIFFVKHGQTPTASAHRLSKGDEGLSEAGQMEAKRAAEALKDELSGMSLTKIIASPRKRTLETARVMADVFDIDAEDIEQDERLTERDCTSYLGQRIADVFSKSEEELVAGGMEPLASLYLRSKDFYDELVAKDVKNAVLLVGHSGNLTPLVYAARGAALGEVVDVPELALDNVLRLK